MSTGLYVHTTRAAGTVLTAAFYNNDHNHHIDNRNPSMMGGYSDAVPTMQAAVDPGGLGTEDIPANLSEELERLRFVVKRVINKIQWYLAPAASLEQIGANGFFTTLKIANDAVTYAKFQDASATARILARKTAGAGDYEETTLSEMLDFVTSAARGDILYRGASDWARLPAGAAGTFLKTGGAGADPSWGAYAVDRQVFTSSGTWNKPLTGKFAVIECWAGGASGGKNNAANGGAGGGGGAYIRRIMALSALGSSETVTIGAGGAAQTSLNTDGNQGGTSSFGTHVQTFGGGGGEGANVGATDGGGGGGLTSAGVVGSGNSDGGGPNGLLGASVWGLGTGGPNCNPFGGGGGTSGLGSAGQTGLFGGGGGGGGADGVAADGGGQSVFGGGGGGGASDTAAAGAGGTSLFGGSGGAGGSGAAANGTAGTIPSGGGGGTAGGNSGAGARGEIIVTVY